MTQGSGSTLITNISSTDNIHDVFFSIQAATINGLLEFPKTNRSKATLDALSNILNGTLALSNDYGMLRRAGGVERLTTIIKLLLVKTVLQPH